MIKGFRQIALLTTISRVLGMLRDIAFAYFLGAGGFMDSWVVAFMIPNLARRLFGEGAAASSFIPIYSQCLHENAEKAKRLACTMVTVIAVVLICIVIVGEGFIWGGYKFLSVYESTNLKLALSSVMLPYMILICVVAIMAGILNAHRHFAAPAFAPVLLNIFIIGSLFLSGWALGLRPGQQLFFVAVSVLIAGLVQVLIQLFPLHSRGVTLEFAWDVHTEAFKKILIMMGPMILGLTVTQINTLADVLIATWFSGSSEKGQFFIFWNSQVGYPLWEGAVSKLFYSQRLYQFPLGILGISLATAIFPVMSSDIAKKNFNAFTKTVSRGIRAALFVAIPATAGLLIVREPLVRAIFQAGKFTTEDTVLTANILCFYAIGLCGFFMQQVVTRAFYSLQDSKMPARTALVAVFVNIVLNLILIWFMAAAGLAFSTAICSYLQVTILLFMLHKRFGTALLKGLASTFIKTAVATVVMAVAGWEILKMTECWPCSRLFDIFRLVLVVPVSAVLYFLMSKLLRIEMLSLLTGRRLN